MAAHIDNYARFADESRKLFLQADQNKIIQKFRLDHDADFLYFHFLGAQTRLNRGDGTIQELSEDNKWIAENVNATVTIYDMLAGRPDLPTCPALSGRFETMSAIGGVIAASHVQKLQNSGEARPFTGHTDSLRRACKKLGGKEAGVSGDVSQILPLFDFFPCWFQFWDGDDEFPSSFQFQFDAHALLFLRYETLWYAMNAIEERLKKWL